MVVLGCWPCILFLDLDKGETLKFCCLNLSPYAQKPGHITDLDTPEHNENINQSLNRDRHLRVTLTWFDTLS